ncbi:PPC domain-containing protein, partial [Singulisphaera rosea]
TLSGLGVGRTTRLIFAEPGLSGTILPSAKPDPNRLEVDISIAPSARVGNHQLTVATPLGIPAFQSFAVSPHAESAEVEPNDDPAKPKAISLPATLIGTIDKPGDVDHFKFHAKAGESLVLEVVAKALGSGLLASLAILDSEGKTLAEAAPPDGVTDPVLTVTVPREGDLVLRVADADYAGSANHFYRINVSSSPYLTDVFPLGIRSGESSTVRVAGLNLGGAEEITMHPPADTQVGQILDVPAHGSDGTSPINRRTVVVGDGTQRVESSTDANDRPEGAESLGVPGGFSGRIEHDGDVDFLRFDAKKGQRLIVEVFGRRLGSPLDSVIEILDAKGNPVPRAVLRPIDQTEVAFRDHTSSASGIRLTRWNNLAINDFLLFGRELTRIKALPRNPDDDCQMWTAQGTRSAFLETTPEHHPMAQPIYKVEIHPPGSVFPPGGVPSMTVNYRNDDGGAGLQKDSRLSFDPPADGTYLVRVEDVRSLGGHLFGYHLVVRKPHPGYTFALNTNNPNVPRGGTTLLTASITRIDGFEAPVAVELEGLPSGVTATNGRIEAGEETTLVALSADASAPAYS